MHKLLALPIVLAVLTGCGGGDDDKKKAKADYLRQAEAVCAKAVAEQEALTTPTAPAQITPYVMKVVSIAEQATAALAALSPPEQDRAQLQTKVLGPLQEQLASGRAYASKVTAAVKANKQGELMTLLANPPTQTKADLRWMKGYGFSSCVEAADTSD